MKGKISFIGFYFFLLIPFVSFSQQAFTVHVVPSAITAVPGIHSGAFANHSGKWIFIGGRIDGIHTMQANMAFPTSGRNDSIFIVDPVLNTYEAVSATTLTGLMYEALCSSNMEYFQDGSNLYMIGGYGSEDSSATWITFPSLISIDLDCLLNKVDSGFPIESCFRQLIDSNLTVTGGAIDKLDSTYYLVFGHRFDGRYSNPPSALFYQQYTHEIRKFSIQDDGVNLSISNYRTLQDTNIYHRRDFTMLPQIYPNHDRGFTVFGGVFQKFIDRPFLTPIDITAANVVHQSAFNENLNQYSTASMSIYDSLNNYMHNVFFGGISLYTLDTVTMSLVEDTLVPFVSTISKVTRDASGVLTESRMQEDMPALKGTNAVFIPDPSVMTLEGKIIDLNALTGNTRVGYIAGGILSDFPNVANLDPIGMSRPNIVLYEVYIDKNINSIPEIKIQNEINNLVVYPNPFNENLIIRFSTIHENKCSIQLFDSKGLLVKELLSNRKGHGEQKFTFSTGGLPAGIYACQIKVGDAIKTILVEKAKE